MTLISSRGTLLSAYQDLQAQAGNTIYPCHVDQLMSLRQQNLELREQQIHAADGLVYFLHQGRPKLAITRGADNPVLQNLKPAVEQLQQGDKYRLKPEAVRPALLSPHTVTIDLLLLEVLGPFFHSSRYMVVAIPTIGYHETLMTPENKKLAFRVHGPARNFPKNMEMLAQAGINTTCLYLLKPDYVVEQACHKPFAQAAWLNSFRFGSNFVSDDCIFSDDHYFHGLPTYQDKAFKDTIRATRAYSGM